MCEYLDYEVTELKRSRIMKVELGSLRPGQWRDLTASEMAEITTAVAGSRKTALDDDYIENGADADSDTEQASDEAPAKVNIADIKHASKSIVSKSPASSRSLTRIDVSKPSEKPGGKKRLSLKKKK